MGTKLKAGVRGTVKKYMTRNQSLRYLQVSLADFRRLCILKGVYPRVPSKKPRGDTTYYLAKDIRMLASEPILMKFREIKAAMKKVVRRQNRYEDDLAERLRENLPTYTLDHVVRERYPSFQSALKDVDDALSLIFLFTYLSSEHDMKDSIPPKVFANCERLTREWNAYIVRSNSLKKSFVSVKGIYYQAEIMGNSITWVVPHEFTQVVPINVDFSVMSTFLEFYQTLLGFVLYRLYSAELQEAYPPKIDLDRDLWVSKMFAKGTTNRLFSGLDFFVSREVPIKPVEFALVSFGARVHSEAAGVSDDNERAITHVVFDRPTMEVQAGRDYVQPQWVFDCINAGILLPVGPYGVGKTLPPHISPFADATSEGYMPERAKEIARLVDAANNGEQELPEQMRAVAAARERIMFAGGKMVEKKKTVDQAVSELEARYAAELKQEVSGTKWTPTETEKIAKAVDSSIVEEEEEVDSELEDGEVVSDEDEFHRQRRLLMTQKQKKLYGAMQHGLRAKRKELRRLESKAAKSSKTQ